MKILLIQHYFESILLMFSKKNFSISKINVVIHVNRPYLNPYSEGDRPKMLNTSEHILRVN